MHLLRHLRVLFLIQFRYANDQITNGSIPDAVPEFHLQSAKTQLE